MSVLEAFCGVRHLSSVTMTDEQFKVPSSLVTRVDRNDKSWVERWLFT